MSIALLVSLALLASLALVAWFSHWLPSYMASSFHISLVRLHCGKICFETIVLKRKKHLCKKHGKLSIKKNQLKSKRFDFQFKKRIEIQKVWLPIQKNELKSKRFDFQFIFSNWKSDCFTFNSFFWIEIFFLPHLIWHHSCDSTKANPLHIAFSKMTKAL